MYINSLGKLIKLPQVAFLSLNSHSIPKISCIISLTDLGKQTWKHESWCFQTSGRVAGVCWSLVPRSPLSPQQHRLLHSRRWACRLLSSLKWNPSWDESDGLDWESFGKELEVMLQEKEDLGGLTEWYTVCRTILYRFAMKKKEMWFDFTCKALKGLQG